MTNTAAILSDVAACVMLGTRVPCQPQPALALRPVSASLHANGEVIPLRIVPHNPSPKGR